MLKGTWNVLRDSYAGESADPEKQTLVLEGVSSETLHLLRSLFQVEHTTLDHRLKFENFSDEEAQQKLTEYVEKLIRQVYRSEMSEEHYESVIQGYRNLQMDLLRATLNKKQSEAGFDPSEP